MASFDVAKLLNKITQDIPGIKTVLTALAKWDLSALTDVPDGAMQATTDSSNRLTIKKKVSGSYVNVGQLQHSADMVDGYHASASATANTVAVRNAQGALPGNVLGNAATADEATKLAAGSVLPVNQGGTGGTTASVARNNLDVAGGADFTAHVTTAGSPSVTGHVALDALAADGSATAAPGGFGLGVPGGAKIAAGTDLDSIVLPGFYSCSRNADVVTLSNCPTTQAFSLDVSFTAYGPRQELHEYGNRLAFVRDKNTATTFSDWAMLPNGITDSLNVESSTRAASATAVKAVNDSTVHTTGNETIGGTKTLTARPVITSNLGEKLRIINEEVTVGSAPAVNQYWQILMRDKNTELAGAFDVRQHTNNGIAARVLAYNKTAAGNSITSEIAVVARADGVSYAICPTPEAAATSNQIATAEWVLSHSSAEQVGDFIASFAATRAGCLLMNGGAVSRTTYAKLFALIGTAFGAGDGTTTFNLPNARDRVLQGANGNLMQYLAAGLPNITGALTQMTNQGTTAGGTGSGAFQETAHVAGGTEGGGYKSYRNYNFIASRSSSIYGASNTVQSAAITCNFFIKY